MSEGRLIDFHTFDSSPLTSTRYTLHAPDAPGVYQVTVFDSIGHVYADRLFFVTRPEVSQPTILLSDLKEQYHPYEQVDFDVASAHPMPGQTVSIKIYRSGRYGTTDITVIANNS